VQESIIPIAYQETFYDTSLILGREEDAKGLQQKAFRYNSSLSHLANQPDKSDSDDFEGVMDSIVTSRDRINMRGFYLHHYASYLMSLSDKPLNYIVKGLGDQYGISGTILAETFFLLKLKVTPQIYIATNLILGLLLVPALVLSVGRSMYGKTGAIISASSWIFTYGIYITTINIEQLILSPGFNAARFLGPAIMCCIWLHMNLRRVDGERYAMYLFLMGATIATNSMQFNIIVLAFSVVSIALRRLESIIYRRPAETTYLSLIERYTLVFTVVIVTMQYIIIRLIVLPGREVFGSAGENQIDLEGYTMFVITSFLMTLLIGIQNRMWSEKGGIRRIVVGSVKGCLPVIGFGYYGYSNYGSPNHLASTILLTLPLVSLFVASMVSSLERIGRVTKVG